MDHSKFRGVSAHHISIAFLLFIISAFNLIISDIAARSIMNGIAIIIVGIYIAFYSDKKFDLFSPGFFIGISFVVFYGLGSILPFLLVGDGYHSRQLKPLLPYYPQATLIVFFSSIFFLIGYKLNIKQFRGSNLFSWNIYGKRLKIVWLIFISFGIISFIILIRYGAFSQSTTQLQSPLFYSIVGFAQPGLIFSLALSYIAMKTFKNAFWKMAFLINFFIFLFFGLPSGSKTLFLLPVIIVAFAYNYSKKYFTKQQAMTSIFVLMLFLAILMPFNAYFRNSQIATNNTSFNSSFTTMINTIEIMNQKGFDEVFNLSIDYMTARLSNISVTAKILQYQETPSSILHMGDSYIRTIYMFFPRFLYPDKPSMTIGRIIAVELGYAQATGLLLGEKASIVSVGITMIGELVYNFSYLAPFGMFLFGILFRWIYKVFLHSYFISPISAIPIYSIIWYMVIFRGGESNFAAVFSGMIKYVLFIFLIFILFKFKRRKFLKQ